MRLDRSMECQSGRKPIDSFVARIMSIVEGAKASTGAWRPADQEP